MMGRDEAPSLENRINLAAIRSRLSESTPLWRLALVLLLTSLGTTHCAPMTWNDESRMATIQSLVESRTFVIDRSDFVSTGDKVSIGGHFYSDKPPMPALLGAVVYAPLYLVGLHLHEGNSVAYFLITLGTIGLFWGLGAIAFFHALAFTTLDAERRLVASLILALGTIYLTWSTTFNNHELAAASLCIGFLFLLRSRFGVPMRRNLLLAGFFLSLSGASDMPTGIFYLLFLWYVIRGPALREATVCYLLPLLVTVVPTLAINYSMHQSILPVQIYRSYFVYPGSPWIGSSELSGMQTNDWGFFLTYAFQTLLGPKGFLLYNPFLIVAAGYLVREIAQHRTFSREAICVAAGSSVLMLYYWATTNNFGGWSYSIRWFVPLIPLVMFFSYPLFQGLKDHGTSYFRLLACVSIVIAFVGTLNPWSPLMYGDIAFVANIRQFVEHMRHPRYMRQDAQALKK